MDIVALLLKSKGTNDVFSISLEWLNNAVFGSTRGTHGTSSERALGNLENHDAFACDSSNVQQSFSGANK